MSYELYNAVKNLINVKGRHHTEIAYARLVEAFDRATAAPVVKEPVMADGKTRLSDYLEDTTPDEAISDEWTKGFEECKRRLFKIVGQQVRTPVQPDRNDYVLICGENPSPLDADLVGCGKPIAFHADVYRCTDCGVPFHKECAKHHFIIDTPEHAAKQIDEQIRRIDAAEGKDAQSKSMCKRIAVQKEDGKP